MEHTLAIFAQRLTGSGFLRRNLAACPLDVKESAYKGLVRPILEYVVQFGTPKAYFFKMNLRRFRKEQLDL